MYLVEFVVEGVTEDSCPFDTLEEALEKAGKWITSTAQDLRSERGDTLYSTVRVSELKILFETEI